MGKLQNTRKREQTYMATRSDGVGGFFMKEEKYDTTV